MFCLNDIFRLSYCIISALVPEEDGKKRKGKKAEPPWNDMDASKGKLSSWIDPKRLPTANEFRFSHPSRMAPEDCYELASWIIRGEEGLNPPSSIFEWVRQHVRPTGLKRPRAVLDEKIRLVSLPIQYIWALILAPRLNRVDSETEEAVAPSSKKKKLQKNKLERTRCPLQS